MKTWMVRAIYYMPVSAYTREEAYEHARQQLAHEPDHLTAVTMRERRRRVVHHQAPQYTEETVQ